jgi:bacteriocin biosynthesis cyclodehydratase domain-containing protein
VATAGVGCVLVEDDTVVRPVDVAPGGYRPDDVGRARASAARQVLAEHAPHTRTQLWGRVRPDLVVLVGHGTVDPVRADGLLREDVPHLAVVWGERDVVVGPLVRPGTSSCLRCAHLHRADRDPEWPRLAAQLATPGRSTPAPAEESVLAACAASLAVAAVVAELDGAQPAVLDAALEVGAPDGAVARRAWPPHPACGCRGLPRVATGERAGTMAR